jgi:hypothetical protein
MLDVGRRIGAGGGWAGMLDGLRIGTGGGDDGGFAVRDSGAALRFGSGGRLRLGGGGGWLTPGRACATASGGWLATGRGGGGCADDGRLTGGGGGPDGRLRGAPTLASAFTGGPEFRFAVMPALHRPIARSAQITQCVKEPGNASLIAPSGTPATAGDIGTVVFRCHGFLGACPRVTGVPTQACPSGPARR